MQNLRYGGPTVKLHLDLQLNTGVGSANPHIVQRSKTVIGWGFNVGASQVVLVVKNPPAQTGDIRDRIDSWIGKIPWSRKWQPTPVVLPGESHGERSLVGFDFHVHTRTSTHAHTHTYTHAHTLWLLHHSGGGRISLFHLTNSLKLVSNAQNQYQLPELCVILFVNST